LAVPAILLRSEALGLAWSLDGGEPRHDARELLWLMKWLMT
jgi:hypothetical protein